ncbi:hypothetical protein NPIL_460701 [Nephila pilipes]|uniref:Uncharacterized protein n=1 Tax=Nephila pilipes TaxID=299642 RepID=A0A8X6N8H0_NEPPI|nr:hypothetical protein NPIL_460701 [Nephila pilipes]
MYEEFQWHFTTTDHGKGALDGILGTFKRRMGEATRYSDIDPYTAEELVTLAKNYKEALEECVEKYTKHGIGRCSENEQCYESEETRWKVMLHQSS